MADSKALETLLRSALSYCAGQIGNDEVLRLVMTSVQPTHFKVLQTVGKDVQFTDKQRARIIDDGVGFPRAGSFVTLEPAFLELCHHYHAVCLKTQTPDVEGGWVSVTKGNRKGRSA